MSTQKYKGIVRGREFSESFPHPRKWTSKSPSITTFRIEAVQEWMKRSTGAITMLPASDWDLCAECPYSEDHDAIGEIKYLLTGHGYKPSRKNIANELRQAPFSARIGLFKSMEAVLNTLFDMGIINAKAVKEALHKYGTRTRSPQTQYRGD